MIKKIPGWALSRSRNKILAAYNLEASPIPIPDYNLFSHPRASHYSPKYSFSILYSFTTYVCIPKCDLVLTLLNFIQIEIYCIYSFWDFFCSVLCLWNWPVLMIYVAAVCVLCYTVFHCMHLWLFIHPVIDGHLEYFWFGANVNNAAVTEAASYPPKHTLPFFRATQLDYIPQSSL